MMTLPAVFPKCFRRRMTILAWQNSLVLAAVLLFHGTISLAADEMKTDMQEIQTCLGKYKYDDLSNSQKCAGVTANRCMNVPYGSSTRVIAGCLLREAAAWEAMSRQFQSDLRTEIESELDSPIWNSDEHRQLIRRQLSQLQEARVAFEAHREAKCDFSYSFHARGTIRGPAYAGCRLHETADWALFLSSLLAR